MELPPLAGIFVTLVALWIGMLVLFWMLRPRDVPVRDVVRIVPDLLRLLRGLISDRGAPADVRLVLVGLVAWIVSPIDLIPEVIPVLGPLDDIVVAVVAFRFVRRRMGVEGLRSRWTGSPEGFDLLLRAIGSS